MLQCETGHQKVAGEAASMAICGMLVLGILSFDRHRKVGGSHPFSRDCFPSSSARAIILSRRMVKHAETMRRRRT